MSWEKFEQGGGNRVHMGKADSNPTSKKTSQIVKKEAQKEREKGWVG